MTEKILATLETIGTDPAFVGPLRAHLNADIEIERARFETSKKNEEKGALVDRTVDQLAGSILAKTAEIDKERDRELAKVWTEERKTRVIESQGTTETSAEYAARIARATTEATRQARRASLTAADVATISLTSDPAGILELVDDVFESQDPAAIRRITLAAEARLQALTVEHRRSSRNVPGSNNPAQEAWSAVQARAKAWRQTPEAQTFASRRKAIEDAYAFKASTLRTQATRAAQTFGLDAALTQRLRLAALADAATRH